MATEKVVLGINESRCLECGAEFETYDLPDMSYGMRTFYTCDGREFGLLVMIPCEAVDEIDAIYERLLPPGTPEDKRRRWFHAVIAEALDPINGKSLSARQGPVCPACSSARIDYQSTRRGKQLELPKFT